jgi:hypothetical protein
MALELYRLSAVRHMRVRAGELNRAAAQMRERREAEALASE